MSSDGVLSAQRGHDGGVVQRGRCYKLLQQVMVWTTIIGLPSSTPESLSDINLRLLFRKNIDHFARRYHEWFPGKVLLVAGHQISIVLAHLDLIEDDIFGIRERFVVGWRPFEVQAIAGDDRQYSINVLRLQMKLFPREYLTILFNDSIVEDRGNVSRKDIRQHCQRGCSWLLGNQSRYDDIRINDCVNLIVLFHLSPHLSPH